MITCTCSAAARRQVQMFVSGWGESENERSVVLTQVFPIPCFHRCTQATLPWPSVRFGSQKIHRISAVVHMTVAEWCTLGPFPTVVCVISGTFLFPGLHGCYTYVCACLWVCLSERNFVYVQKHTNHNMVPEVVRIPRSWHHPNSCQMCLGILFSSVTLHTGGANSKISEKKNEKISIREELSQMIHLGGNLRPI